MSVTNKLKFLFNIILFASLLFILGCVSEEADLGPADQLLQSEQYDQALIVLNNALKNEYSDTTQYDRIKHRIFLAHKGKFFIPLNLVIKRKDWAGVKSEIHRLGQVLKSMPADSSRNYYFDYYCLKAVTDSALNDKKSWMRSLTEAIQFPLAEKKREKDILGRLARHHAEEQDFSKALDLMDRMMSKMIISELTESLKMIFYIYQEGKFKTAGQLLSELPDGQKDVHWKRLEIFLNSHHKQLKQQDRFKLW